MHVYVQIACCVHIQYTYSVYHLDNSVILRLSPQLLSNTVHNSDEKTLGNMARSVLCINPTSLSF